MNTNSKNYKIVILGESGVGKTSIINRICGGSFDEHPESTIGAAFRNIRHYDKNKKLMNLNMWDTAGQERYDSIVPIYYRSASVAIVTYDITSPESFIKAKKWIERMENNQPKHIFLVGNKKDLNSKKKVMYSEAMAFINSKSYLIIYKTTSAKTKEGITELFDSLVKVLENTKEFIPEVSLVQQEPTNSWGCC